VIQFVLKIKIKLGSSFIEIKIWWRSYLPPLRPRRSRCNAWEHWETAWREMSRPNPMKPLSKWVFYRFEPSVGPSEPSIPSWRKRPWGCRITAGWEAKSNPITQNNTLPSES
jgi:hypothetical protein